MAKTTKDRYGLAVTSMNHKAAMLFEQGASQKQIEHHLGRPFYNLIARLEKAGHKVERKAVGAKQSSWIITLAPKNPETD